MGQAHIVGSNPAADKSLVLKWRRLEGGRVNHQVPNRTPLKLGDFTDILREVRTVHRIKRRCLTNLFYFREIITRTQTNQKDVKIRPVCLRDVIEKHK